MNKIITLLLAGCLMVLAPTASFATIQTFTRFSVDVPQGWEASEDGSVVALLAPGHVAALSIAVDSAENMSPEVLASAMASQLKGSSPTPTDDGGYEFSFQNPSGVESHSLLYVEDNEYILITMTGNHPDFVRILQSLEDN